MKINEFVEKLKEQKDNMYAITIEECEYGTLKDVLSDKNKFNYAGVYAIYNEKDEIIYVGESYKVTVGHRLYLHYCANSSNSTFGKKFSIALFGHPKEELTDEQIQQLQEKLKALKVLAFRYVDWESYLIDTAKPEFNTRGKSKN